PARQRLRGGHQRRRREWHADARPRLRRGFHRRRRHERCEDRRGPVHRSAGHGRGPAVRAPRARFAPQPRRCRRAGTGRHPALGHRRPPVKLLVATTNPGKLREIAGILEGLPIELVSLAQLPPIDEPEETGATFAENARLKALYYHRATKLPSIADD